MQNVPIEFSESAAAKIRALKSVEGDNSLMLRVFITGGGCNGFSYGFTFDNDVAEDDAVVERDGETMVVDSMSYPYLEGASIEFVEDLSGSQFVVSNPNAALPVAAVTHFQFEAPHRPALGFYRLRRGSSRLVIL